MKTKELIKDIRWLGYGGIFIKSKPAIYIDPYNLAFPDIGDLILISSNHEYHCAPEEIKWLRKGSTTLIVPPDCVNLFFGGDIQSAIPGNEYEKKGVTISITSAYKGSDDVNNVGYVITYPNARTIYYTGQITTVDDNPPDSIDVLIIPYGSTVGIDSNLIIKVINAINPKVTIPIDWDNKPATKKELNYIDQQCESDLVLLKPKN